jgi:exosortase/archaeosortase family protein
LSKFSLSAWLRRLLPDNKIALFLLKFLALFLSWNVLNEYLIETAGSGTFIVRVWFYGYHILLKSLMFLSVPLTSVFTDVQITTTYNTIILGNHGFLFIGHPCLCADVIFLFTFFIIAYPGRWKAKLWYIPLGIVAIQLINVMRIVAFCLLKIYHPEMLRINHKYIFNIIVLAFVFVFWIIWIARYSEVDLLKKKATKENDKETTNDKNQE